MRVNERVAALEVKQEQGERLVAFKLEQVIDKLDELCKIGERVTALETARAVQKAWIAGAAFAGTALGGVLGWALSRLIHIPG
jgi:hypothetical protein